MKISVICPTFNEEQNIGNIINFFLSAKPLEKEFFIIDGGSTDKTREIIKKFSNSYPNIYLLDNPNRFVSFALNLGIDRSNSDIIVRIDAHSKYSEDYFEKIIETFDAVDADIVGGPYLTAFKTDFQNAVGQAISTKFGIGNSKSHQADYKGYLDSVAFGAFKKKIFFEIGKFDERLIRNQDDEFNYRANSLGKKVYQNPEIKFWYYPRSSLRDLFIQYFQYGLYKPLVLHKVKSESKFRHLIPSFFVLYLLSLPFLISSLWIKLPLAFYLLALAIVSFTRKGNFKIKIFSLSIFPAIHVSYGIGFLIGLFKLKILD